MPWPVTTSPVKAHNTRIATRKTVFIAVAPGLSIDGAKHSTCLLHTPNKGPGQLPSNPAAQKPYLLNESRKLRGGFGGADDLSTPQVLRAAGVQPINAMMGRGTATP